MIDRLLLSSVLGAEGSGWDSGGVFLTLKRFYRIAVHHFSTSGCGCKCGSRGTMGGDMARVPKMVGVAEDAGRWSLRG